MARDASLQSGKRSKIVRPLKNQVKLRLNGLICVLMLAVLLFTSCNGSTGGENTGGSDDQSAPVSNAPTEESTHIPSGGERVFVSIVSYNLAYYESGSAMAVAYADQTEADYTIAKRQLRLKSLIDHYQPDIFCLQEVNYKWWQYLITDEDSLLQQTGYRYVGNTSACGNSDGAGSDEREMYNLLFYDPELFDCADSGTFWCNRRRTRHSGSGSPNIERVCTYAILKDKRTGQEVMYASVHLPTVTSTNYDLNLTQMGFLIQYANEIADGRPIVICGDYNIGASTNQGINYAQMIDAGFLDAAASASKRDGRGTFRCWGVNPNLRGDALDHCFYRGIKAYEMRVLADTFDSENVINTDGTTGGGYYDLSDHVGLWIKLSFS